MGVNRSSNYYDFALDVPGASIQTTVTADYKAQPDDDHDINNNWFKHVTYAPSATCCQDYRG